MWLRAMLPVTGLFHVLWDIGPIYQQEEFFFNMFIATLFIRMKTKSNPNAINRRMDKHNKHTVLYQYTWNIKE